MLSSATSEVPDAPSISVTPNPPDPRITAVEEQIEALFTRIAKHRMDIDVPGLLAEANKAYIFTLITSGVISVEEARLGTLECSFRLLSEHYRRACERKRPRKTKQPKQVV